MLALNNQTAKLANLNIRAELHGDTTKVATDLKFEIKVPNTMLDEFDPALLSALYRAPDESDSQGELPVNDPNYLPKLKFPQMGAIKWDWKGAGYAVTVHYGVSGKQDVLMLQSEVDGFRFDCQDGGTVAISFRVAAHPQPEEIGLLSELIQSEVSITLEPPSAEDLLKQQLKDAEDEE